MIKKFKVGDRVKHFNDISLGTISYIKTGNNPYVVTWDDTGEYSACTVSELVPIQPETQEPVVEGPIPGKFYRTRGGDKMMFLCKGSSSYFYEDDSGAAIGYDLPFIYSIRTYDGFTSDSDIVGEWVDEVVLPAVEIKRWAIVQREDKRIEYGYAGGRTDEGFKDIKRGYILKCSSDKEYLKRHLEADEEIVELTGTLPERKI